MTIQKSSGSQELFDHLCETVKALRDPETGCPWDLKQTHSSLCKYMLEESYEAVEAILSGDKASIIDELGDVLLQVVLHSQLAIDAGEFSIDEVVGGLTRKLVRRHPHVFDTKQNLSTEQVEANWESIKKSEKKELEPKNKSLLGDAKKISKVYPASKQAVAIGKKTSKVDFDWENVTDVIKKLESELEELKEAINETNQDKISDELGDVYFTLNQIARHLKVDPEVASYSGNLKFIGRFEKMEKILESKNMNLEQLSIEEKQSLWEEAKKSK